MEFDPASCRGCDLQYNGMHAYSRVHKGIGRKVMFIGEAPGRKEGEQHLAFVGDSGKMLNAWINYMLVSNYIITNAVRHRPVTSTGTNRTPNSKEIIACNKYLEDEIKHEQPKFIVYLGKTSLTSRGITVRKMKDSVIHSFVNPYWYGKNGEIGIVLFHPSYVTRKHYDITPLLDMLADIILNPPVKDEIHPTVKKMIGEVGFPA